MKLTHLKQLLTRHGVTQSDLARMIGRDKAVVSNLVHGRRQLKANEAALIARHIGVPVAQVIGMVECSGTGRSEAMLLIPFLHPPAKSNANIVSKEGSFYLEMDGRGLSAKAYALEVEDDSMNLLGILAGDIVIWEFDRPCKPGQIVVARHGQGQAAKTVIRQYEPPFLVPHSRTRSFRPISLERGDALLVSPLVKLIRVF